MRSFPRYVAPAGAPIGSRDVVASVRAYFAGHNVDALAAEVRVRLGVKHCRVASTGRAALTLLLKALHRLAPADRTEVILPSYTCFSVAAAVVRAGLTPRVVDVVPETLDYSHDALGHAPAERALAVVACNLYGLPNNMPALETFSRRNGVFLIDDAAQALGATAGGRMSGTWGDAGIFSFDKGKNLSAIDGGVIVTHSDAIADALDQELRFAHVPAISEVCVSLLKLGAYVALLRPSLYWIPARIPGLGLGTTLFDVKFPLQLPHAHLASLALTMMRRGRLEAFTRIRQQNAAALRSRISSELPHVVLVEPVSGTVPVYVRLPILVRDRLEQRRVIAALNAAGIGATGSYPSSLLDVPELAESIVGTDAKGGRNVAERLVTLPTHPYVTRRDLERTTIVLARATSGRAKELSYAVAR